MHLVALYDWQVVAYVNENTARGLRAGDPTHVFAEAAPLHALKAHVVSVAPAPNAQLDEPILAQSNGGSIDARETSSGWLPTQPIFRVEVALDQPFDMPLRVWRGHVVFKGEAISYSQRCWNSITAAGIREAGF